MSYEIYILSRAQKEMSQLPDIEYKQIRDAILGLGENPRPYGCKKLKGRDGWRIRAGKFRIIYEINDQKRIVTIFHIGHRRDVYR